MNKYMLIESRDPFESNAVARLSELAQALVGAGNEVSVFLVQNAVLPARRGAQADALAALVAGGVKVLADDFSLRERAIPFERLMPGVSPAGIEAVVDAMAEKARIIWH